jgi:hypothetical protein
MTVLALAGPSLGKVNTANHTVAVRATRSTWTDRSRLSFNAVFRPRRMSSLSTGPA